MSTRLTVLFFIAVVALASCKSDDNLLTNKVSTYLNVVNASADNINFYVNGTRQNNSSALTPGGQTFYLTVPAGTQNFQIKKDGSPDYLMSIPLNLKDSVYNSLYIAGESIDKTIVKPDTLLTDTLTIHKTSAQLRFVNTTPGGGVFDVKIGDTLRFRGDFKSVSSFIYLGSGLKRIKVYRTGSPTALSSDTLAMSPGKGYTIFTKGTIDGTGTQKLHVGVALNFQ